MPAVTGGWIFDDHPLVAGNPYVHSFHDWPRWFVTDFWNVDEEILRLGSRMLYWRPAVTASYALDWQLGGGSPVMFHVTNLVLHAVVSALAFITLRRWTGALWPAFGAALLFAVHPTKAESVAWIAGRTDIACLLTVLIASAGIARRLGGKRGGMAIEAAATIAAYLCKEQAIVLPCFAAVEVWVALDRPALDRAVLVRMIRGALPQAAIAAGYLVVRALVLPIGPAEQASHVPLGQHALMVSETFGRFAALAFAPHDLSIQQGLTHSIHHELVHAVGYVVLGVVASAALLAAAWWTRRRMPIVAVGIAFYLAALLPTSNIVDTDMATLISERFLYLPLLGLALAIGGLVSAAHRCWGQRSWAVVALGVVALGAISARRSADYRDEDAFWSRELALHPDSAQARFETVSHDLREHRLYDALAALKTDAPYDASTREHLSLALQVARVMSQLVPDHAVAELAALDRFCADLLAGLPATLALRGVQFAIDLSRRANQPSLTVMRPRFLALRADLQSRLGHDDMAVALASDAVERCQTCWSIVTVYVLVLARAGRYDDSIAVLDAAEGHMQEHHLSQVRTAIEAARELSARADTLQGPAALQARASELTKLELWGRAFDLLAPYEAEIAQAPSFVTGFAELAFRAGEPATARRVLAATRSPAEVDALLARWTAKTGWLR